MTPTPKIEFIRPRWPAPAAVEACCSTRLGGVSAPPWNGFNLARHVGDDAAAVAHNRQLLRSALGLPGEPCWLEQTHGTRVVRLEADDERRADGAVTAEPGRVAVVMTADCLPILLCARHGAEVAAVHAGWRGLAAGVLESALGAMTTPPGELIAWIGPAIGQPHFEVGEDVRAAFCDGAAERGRFFAANRPGHYRCDLGGLAEGVLAAAGVARVFRSPQCSFADAERFYSYRRDGVTGRMATLIYINGKAPASLEKAGVKLT